MSSQLAPSPPHKSSAKLLLPSPLLPFAHVDMLSLPPIHNPGPRLEDTDWHTVPQTCVSPPIRIAVDLAYEPYPDINYVVPALPGLPTHTHISKINLSVRTRHDLEFHSTTYSLEADTADKIVLFTRQPTVSFHLGSFTHVHEGADFLDYFKKALPKFLTCPVTFYVDISISVRGCLARAVCPSEHTAPIPALGDTFTIPYLTNFVDNIIDHHGGSELVCHFLWHCSDYILLVNIVPKVLLRRYLDNPKAVAGGDIFTKYNGSSDPFEEFDNNKLTRECTHELTCGSTRRSTREFSMSLNLKPTLAWVLQSRRLYLTWI
ncbi:hypothetical protein BD410DRAFT_844396 [Rickenella mellea]|uniref:Uncharacterized protein n=1 Tax=Rickenella mellea TaxID=50990 RepID=A0A4Y7PNL0_9AGAM|nr:hypothetical protein BD410DRAFT_844396 [Rickenella mellea]